MRDYYCSYEQGMFSTEPAGARDGLYFHQALAFHEAGHAVCGYALGFGCSRIVMSEDIDETRAQAACAYFGARRAQRRVYAALRAGGYSPLLARRAVVCAAGAAAERRFDLESALPLRTLSGAVDDHREIEAIAERLSSAAGRNPLAFRRMIWRQAQRMMMQPAVWRATQDLAARLAALLPAPGATPRASKCYATLEGAAARAIIRRAGVAPSVLPDEARTSAAVSLQARRETL
jgi:hypothetical protein